MTGLKASSIWVNWTLDPEKGKIPKNPKTGGNAQSNNPATWATYELAEQETPKYDGIGFMFADGICGIDIDVKEDKPHLTSEQIQEVIQQFDTYTEYSPSGSGYHIIFKCDLSRIPQTKGKLSTEYYQKNPHNGLECYFAGLTNRFFTYTGEAVNGRDIEDRTDQVLMLLDKYMRKKKSPPQRATAAEDGRGTGRIVPMDIISIARKARNGKKFTALYDAGDISGYNSQSEADLALCDMLVFYTRDPGEIDLLFRQSKLYREKWEREDYRNDTINKALSDHMGDYYTPKKRGRPKNSNTPVIVAQHAGAVYFNPFETPEKRQRYGMNDIGAGNLFADVYKNVSRFVPEANMWYVYDGRVWTPDVGGAVVAQQAKDLTDYMLDCRKFIEDDSTEEIWVKFVSGRMKRNARETMLKDAQTVYPVYIKDFDKDPYLFNCQNCTLNLRDFTLHSHRPDDYLSKISNVVFDKGARCDRWKQFISEIMRGDIETAKFIQKALGYTLTGDTSEECFFILYGSTTRNGKGTTMETTLHILGDYGRTAQPETIAQKQFASSGNPSEDIARLKGARFVNMSEPDKGLRLNSALVKQVTGGDSITARFLHQNSFEYRPEYKLFINTNHLPRVSDDSIFASGRVKLIPFERHFPENEQDKSLKTFFKQPENMSGIFNWFIEGLKLMRAEGIQQPQSVKDATDQYREDSDTVGLFVRECLIECKGMQTPLKDVHAEYSKWCEGNGYGALNSRNLGAELRRKGLKTDRGTGNKVCLSGYGILVSDDSLIPEWR